MCAHHPQRELTSSYMWQWTIAYLSQGKEIHLPYDSRIPEGSTVRLSTLQAHTNEFQDTPKHALSNEDEEVLVRIIAHLRA